MIRYVHGPFKNQRLRDLARERMQRGEECGCTTCERLHRTITQLPPEWCNIAVPPWKVSSGRPQGSYWIGSKTGDNWAGAE